MKLSKLLANIKVLNDYTDIDVADIIYDSRKVFPGCAFVCLCGASSDGHDYAKEAVQSGASVIIAQKNIDVEAELVLVENTRQALAYMSAEFFMHPAKKMKTAAITGTKGKTTVSYMMQSILEAQGYKAGIIGTVGVLIGEEIKKTNNTTPESYEVHKYMKKMVDSGCDICVMEVSSIGLKDFRVAGVFFDIGIFTNFSKDHIGGNEHKDMQEYLESKSILFKQCKTGIINIDDENYEQIIKDCVCEIQTYGFNKNANWRARGNELISKPGYLGVHFDLQSKESYPINVSVPGRFSVYNALAALSASYLLGANKQTVLKGLDNVKAKGRVEPVKVSGNYTLLIDYAHNAISMESILTTLREYKPNRLICMFGAGGNRPKIRRYEMGRASGKLADLSVITEDNSRFEDIQDILSDIEVGLKETSGEYVKIPDRKEAIAYCIENAQDGDIIVFAGKGHEDYQEIKGVKYHFDEREIVEEILQSLK